MSTKDTDERFHQALITSATALGLKDPIIQRTLFENSLEIEQVESPEGHYYQLNDLSEGDKVPLYHERLLTGDLNDDRLTHLEEAFTELERIGHGDLKEALYRQIQEVLVNPRELTL